MESNGEVTLKLDTGDIVETTRPKLESRPGSAPQNFLQRIFGKPSSPKKSSESTFFL